MILTSKEVLFVKESSGAVVDRLPLRAITFVSRVNLAQTVRRHSITAATTKTSRTASKRALSNLSTSIGSMSGIIARAAPPAPADDDAAADSDGSGGFAAAAAAAALSRLRACRSGWGWSGVALGQAW